MWKQGSMDKEGVFQEFIILNGFLWRVSGKHGAKTRRRYLFWVWGLSECGRDGAELSVWNIEAIKNSLLSIFILNPASRTTGAWDFSKWNQFGGKWHNNFCLKILINLKAWNVKESLQNTFDQTIPQPNLITLQREKNCSDENVFHST